jgi:hypothetical protein
MIQATRFDNQDQNHARDYLTERSIATTEGVFWNMKSVSLHTLIVPDVLHTIYLGILKHLMEWIVPFLEFHKQIDRFNDLWAIMPYYPGFARFNKPYTAVTQWSGKEMKALGCVIVPIVTTMLFDPSSEQQGPFESAMLCVKTSSTFTS